MRSGSKKEFERALFEKLRGFSGSSYRQQISNKSYMDLVKKTEGVLKKQGLSFRSLDSIKREFIEKSKFDITKGSTPLSASSERATGFLNELEKRILNSVFYKGKNRLSELNKVYGRDRAILDILEKSKLPDSFNIKEMFSNRALLFALLGTSLGVGGPTLAAVSYAGLTSWRDKTGWQLLNTAKNFEKASIWFKNAKTPKKLEALMKFTSSNPPQKINLSGVSSYILQKPIKDQKSFDEEYNRLDEVEKMTKGQEETYEAIETSGGFNNAQNFTEASIQLKSHIMNTKPKPYIQQNGEPFYSKSEENEWLYNLNKIITPQHFVNAVSNGEVSESDISAFSKLYPFFFQNFLTSLVNTESAKKDRNVQSFLSLALRDDLQDKVLYMQDQIQKSKSFGKNRGSPRQFSPKSLSSQSISNVAQSGTQ